MRGASAPMSVQQALASCPTWAPALGFGGATVAIVFASLGSAYGTGKAAQGISAIGVGKPEIVMKNIIPVVMAGVLGIYGLIIAVIISNAVKPVGSGPGSYSDYSQFTGFAHLAAGLCCGYVPLLRRRMICAAPAMPCQSPEATQGTSACCFAVCCCSSSSFPLLPAPSPEGS